MITARQDFFDQKIQNRCLPAGDMNGKDSMMQAGSAFLPCTSKTRLQRRRRKGADPKARDRLLAFVTRKDRPQHAG